MVAHYFKSIRGERSKGTRPLGSWVTYGLGSENENLPGYVVMLDPRGGPTSGAPNWSSGYMPAAYQGTLLRSSPTYPEFSTS